MLWDSRSPLLQKVLQAAAPTSRVNLETGSEKLSDDRKMETCVSRFPRWSSFPDSILPSAAITGPAEASTNQGEILDHVTGSLHASGAGVNNYGVRMAHLLLYFHPFVMGRYNCFVVLLFTLFLLVLIP